MNRKISSPIISALFLGLGCPCASAFTPPLHFEKDTVGFANMTVFEYQNGIARVRRGESAKQKRYTRRCFVLCRTTMQFKKFARFDPHAPPLSDEDLAKRIRQVTRRAAWHDTLPEEQRVVFPGFANFREMSVKRGYIVQRNIGYGWPTYWRLGTYGLITLCWFIQRSPGARPTPTSTLFTTQIILMNRGRLPGRNASVHLLTKKTGISSAETYAFTRFTACRCSKGLRRDELLLVLDAQKRVPLVRNRVALPGFP
ncbi:MAG: hypothetical protein AUG81_06035 [Verrucomicrobia bacterium 13_1_20CM_4_54_11]|nr:MAG: hypothetical protein AUG81_06035 [Verrucomicrobia bacterium 13_1_20CM_4_54_11]